MNKKVLKVSVIITLSLLVVACFMVGGFLLYEEFKPAPKPETKTEEKKAEAPEGRGSGAGTGVTLNSMADAIVGSFQPNANYGNTPGMDVSHNDNPHNESWGLIRFDLSSIPTNSVIDSATLKLQVGICGGPGPTMLSASQATNPWDEMTVTWANKPSYSGGVPKSSLCTLPSTHSLDVKEIVKKWVNYSEKNYGLVIHGSDSGSWDFGFCTKENSNFQLRPQLDIAYHESSVNPPQGGNQGGNNTGSSGQNSAGTIRIPSASQQSAIQAPIFSYLVKNGTKMEPPINDVVEMKEGDSIEAFGTAAKDLRVVIFIRGFANDPVTDGEGNWSFKFDPLKVPEEEAMVQTQVYTASGDSSAVTDMFKIKKVAGAKVSETKPKNSFWQDLTGKYLWYFIGTLSLLLIGLSVIFGVLFWKRKRGTNEKQ